MGWVFRRAHEAFDTYRKQWDAINKRCGNHLLLDSQFVQPLLRYFGNREVLVSVPESAADGAMLLVHKRRHGFWETFQPAQAPLGLVLIGPGHDTFGVVQTLMRALPGPALGLALLQQDPAFTALTPVPSRHMEWVEYIDTPTLTLSGSFDDYWRAQGPAIEATHHLTKRLRRLARLQVRLTLRVDRHPDRVAECVAQHGRLEQTGWKGRAGTAVAAENHQGAFYTDILMNFCARNEGVIYRLYFNDQVVASQLALERNGMLIFLKTAYDEQQKALSPGFLLQLEILKCLHTEGRVKRIEFYGRVRDWHTKWRAQTRTMYHVHCDRGAWVTAMRRLVKKVRGSARKWHARQGLRIPHEDCH
jgi:hypothetical protein